MKGGVRELLNERIVKLRKLRNITQEELARRIRSTRSALSQYELGTRSPDYDTLKRMADYFEVSTDFLLGKDDSKKEVEIDEIKMKLLAGFDKLSDVDKEYLVGLIERMPKKSD